MNIKIEIFAGILCLFLHTINGMDKSITEVVVVLPNDEIALRLVGCHYLNDHNDIAAFAETNKAYNQHMVAFASTRKNLLRKEITGKRLGSIYHKYGSRYGLAYHQEKLNQLVLMYLTLNNGMPSESSNHLGEFVFPLPYAQVPFFNNKGAFCFYGYGTVRLDSASENAQAEKQCTTILQYQSILLERSRRLCCLMAKEGDTIAGKQMYRRFDFCMEYPHLLQAILNSRQVTHSSNGQEVIFWLDGVIIPDDYEEIVPLDGLSENWKHNKFEHLPSVIRDFITKNRN